MDPQSSQSSALSHQEKPGAAAIPAQQIVGTRVTPFAELRSSHAPREIRISNVPLTSLEGLLQTFLFPGERSVLQIGDIVDLIDCARGGRVLSDKLLSHLAPESSELDVRIVQRLTTWGGVISYHSDLELETSTASLSSPLVRLRPQLDTSVCTVIISWEGELQNASQQQVEQRWDEAISACEQALGANSIPLEWLRSDAEQQLYFSGSQIMLFASPRTHELEDLSAQIHLSQHPELRFLCASIGIHDEDGNQETIESRARGLHLQLARLLYIDPPLPDMDRNVLDENDLSAKLDEQLLPPQGPPFQIVRIGQRLLVLGRASTGASALEDLAALRRYEEAVAGRSLRHPLDGITGVEVARCTREAVDSLLMTLNALPQQATMTAVVEFLRGDAALDVVRWRDGLYEMAACGLGIECLVIEQVELWSDGGDDAARVMMNRSRVASFTPSNGHDLEEVPTLLILPCRGLLGISVPSSVHQGEGPLLDAVVSYLGGVRTNGERGFLPPKLVDEIMSTIGVNDQSYLDVPLELLPESADGVAHVRPGVRVTAS